MKFSLVLFVRGLNSNKGFLRCENVTEKKSFDRPNVLIDDEDKLQRFWELAKKSIGASYTAIEYTVLACDYWKMKETKLREFGITDF